MRPWAYCSSRICLRVLMLVATTVSIVALSGCWVSSINPLYEDELFSKPDPDIVLDPRFEGTWSFKQDEDCLGVLTITAKENVYHMTAALSSQCKSEEKPSKYEGHLVKLDTHVFLDVGPEPNDVCEMCLPQHHILLARIEKGSFSLTPIDDEWLKTSIGQKTLTIQTLSGKPEILTASSRALKEFVRKYADDKSAFKPVPEFTYKRQ